MKRWTSLFPRPIVPKQPRGRTVGSNRKFKITAANGREYWVTYLTMIGRIPNVHCYEEEKIEVIDLVARHPERWASLGQFMREAMREKLEREGCEVPPQDFFIESTKEIRGPGRPPAPF